LTTCAAPLPRFLRADRRGGRARARGVTLIEVLVVMFIVVLMSGGVLYGIGAVQRSRLKSSASRVAAAMRVGYARAASTGKRLRLVLDFESRTLWLEESTSAMLLDAKDVTGAGGADPATEVEKAALAEANRINAGVQVARPSFQKIGGLIGETGSLHHGISFRAVDAAHADKPQTAGHAYVYFFGAEAERASVQLSIGGSNDDHDTLSVVVAPLTGRATIADGPVAVPHPRDDAEASEAEDEGH
jgi:general secretion pathway protein H